MHVRSLLETKDASKWNTMKDFGSTQSSNQPVLASAKTENEAAHSEATVCPWDGQEAIRRQSLQAGYTQSETAETFEAQASPNTGSPREGYFETVQTLSSSV